MHVAEFLLLSKVQSEKEKDSLKRVKLCVQHKTNLNVCLIFLSFVFFHKVIGAYCTHYSHTQNMHFLLYHQLNSHLII